MRMSKFSKSAAIAAVSAALVFGAAAPAIASPGLPSPGINSPGLSLPSNAVGEKVKVGTVGGPVWSGDVYTQIVRGAKVYPKRTVTIRVEVVGTSNRETKLKGIGHNMPKEFKLKSVTRQSSDKLFGAGIYTLKPGEYVSTENNGYTETRLSWREDVFLGVFKDDPTVSNTKSIAVDFTYEAPDYEGEFNHGPFASVGAVFGPEKSWITGGQKVTVEKSAQTFFSV